MSWLFKETIMQHECKTEAELERGDFILVDLGAASVQTKGDSGGQREGQIQARLPN
jgi:hypothetical protein